MWIGDIWYSLYKPHQTFHSKSSPKRLQTRVRWKAGFFLTIQKDRNHYGSTGRVNSRPVLPHSIGYYHGIGQCIGRRKSRNLKQTFSRRIKSKVPDFLRNQELFGGDYWTRTSDLLRVKIRLNIKGLILGAFWYFWLHFFRAGKRSLSTVSAC